jgi:two-component system response regulator FlrC
VFAIRLPSLRERREEILPLALRFLHESHGEGPISPAAARLLMAYAWPGNVRELRNVMERAAILCPAGEVLPVHLPPLDAGANDDELETDDRSLRGAERRFLETALREHGGNIQATARALGVSRGTLYRKIGRYKLSGGDPPQDE